MGIKYEGNMHSNGNYRKGCIITEMITVEYPDHATHYLYFTTTLS